LASKEDKMPASELLIGNTGYSNVSISLEDRYLIRGWAWRVGTGYVTLASANDYVTINFTTPATGTTLYSFANVDKTGNELLVSFIEGGTYAGGSSTPLWNYNRVVGDASPPFAAKTGLSTASATITGGTSSPIRLIPGNAQGANKSAATSEAVDGIILKPNTSYTLKISAVGSSTTLAAYISVIWVA